MRKNLFPGILAAMAALLVSGCAKSPETIVNEVYKSATEDKFGNIGAYVLPDSIEALSEAELETFAGFVRQAISADSYASYAVDSVVADAEGTQAHFVVKTNFKDGRSYTEQGELRKTANGNWRLMVDREATDKEDVYSVSDPDKMTPELMRNLHYATVMTLASRGLPQYQVMAADILNEGILTSLDAERALDLLKSAADKNYVPAYRKLGNMYRDGGKNVEVDREKAHEWYMKAAEAGDVLAYSEVGYDFSEGKGTIKDIDKAKEWFEKGVAKGDAKSMRLLGYMYHHQFKDFETDLEKTFDLWNKAYEAAKKAGDEREAAFSANNIGACYMGGYGTAQDTKKALEWYAIAAENGDELPMENLGATYYWGETGIDKDYDKAFYWYTKAAKAGSVKGQYMVGQCYEYGRGVNMNKTKAKSIYWDLWNEHSYTPARDSYGRLYNY